MLSRTALVLALVGCASAHMGVTINQGGTILPRSQKTVYDAYRYPNAGVCHGTTAGDIQMTLTAGAEVKAPMSSGAGHVGGHCVWAVSTDQVKWYKIHDKIDCTEAVGGSNHDFVMPAAVPSICGTGKCVLGWFWTPRESGSCEIYHNCFDVKITGATGTIPVAGAVELTTPLTCSRVDGSGKTTHYGEFGVLPGGGAGPTPPPVPTGATPSVPPSTTDDTGCITYTVVAGDTLSAIALNYDTTLEAITALNNIADANAIVVGQQIKIPGDCKPGTGGSTPATGPTSTPASGPAASDLKMVEAVATFDDAVYKGTVTFNQMASGTTGEHVTINLHLKSNVESTGHKWHVHEEAADDACAKLGGHYNPKNVDTAAADYSISCAASKINCESGDLNGKWGPLNFKTEFVDIVRNDQDLTLVGTESIVGRSIAIHGPNGDASVVACATITLVGGGGSTGGSDAGTGDGKDDLDAASSRSPAVWSVLAGAVLLVANWMRN